MSIKCQENINIETINAEVEKTSKIWEDMITYLKQYNELNRDYLKKLTAFTQKNNSKLLLSHIDTKDEKEKILYSFGQARLVDSSSDPLDEPPHRRPRPFERHCASVGAGAAQFSIKNSK